MLLDFSDQTGTGIFSMVWSLPSGYAGVATFELSSNLVVILLSESVELCIIMNELTKQTEVIQTHPCDACAPSRPSATVAAAAAAGNNAARAIQHVPHRRRLRRAPLALRGRITQSLNYSRRLPDSVGTCCLRRHDYKLGYLQPGEWMEINANILSN